MSNSLEPDQARHFVGPDLGLNCLQRLSADDTSMQIIGLQDSGLQNIRDFGTYHITFPLNTLFDVTSGAADLIFGLSITSMLCVCKKRML